LTLDEQVGQPIGTLIDHADTNSAVTKDSELTCKITNEFNEIIAEGTIGSPLILNPDFPIGPLFIPSGFFPPGQYTIEVFNSVGDKPDVQDVHDVIVVVHANEYSLGDFVNPP
jgi:hypothetical protein